MSSIFTPYFFILLVSQFFTLRCLTQTLTDQSSLLSFKSGLISDPLQKTQSWNESTHFCRWIGITCSLRHQRVTKLDLSSSMLVGSLSPSLGNLSFLREIQLYNNTFTGQIPPEIGNLSRLKILSLENNSFSGEIPTNLSNCFNLIKLGLGGNSLIGSIPLQFQSFSNLELFFLYLNNLTGQLPSYLGNISSLVSISVGGNSFSGKIPDTLDRLTNLEYIEIGLNNLSGTFPPSFFNISSLTNIDIPQNKIYGNLPEDIFITLPRLQKLNIPSNKLTGNIPSSVSNASELLLFAINGNAFTGTVPSFDGMRKIEWLAINRNEFGNNLNFMMSLLNCTRLELLHLSENNLRGSLPRFIGNFSSLRRFTLGHNLIYGNIPDEIGQMSNLETLYLWSNELTGNIPDSIGKLRDLKILSLMQNKLSGEIPFSFENLTMLTELYLQGNNFQGIIPPAIGKMQSLLAMDISNNNFSGNLPREISSLPSLSEFLDVSSNSLTGPLPSDLISLQHLVLLNLSNNLFSGPVPDSFGSLMDMRELYLAKNFFNGTISRFLSSLRSLEVLDLSHNEFTGEIPKFLENFAFLSTLNLSFNGFEGRVPTGGVFQDLSAVLVHNNPMLCGGVSELDLPMCSNSEKSKKSRISKSLKLILSICGSFVVVGLVLLLFGFVHYRKQKKKMISSDNSSTGLLPMVSFQSLYKATNGFSEANLIGSGNFSSVYRGILDDIQTVVAIKVLKLEVKGADRSFLAECEALRSIRHRNLVKVLTSCSSVDFQGNDFKAIVYPHLVNGSLHDWLHGTGRDVQGQKRHLTLLRRLNVAIDVACALDYLHHQCGTPLVHRDLKPSNVLLDGEFVARVSDFGLAKFVQEGTNQYNSSGGVKGTTGYAAPEYGMGREPSTYGDVYSYGILLLELFTGKCPTDDVFSNGSTLHNFVKIAIPERVLEICDPVIVYDDEGDKDKCDYSEEEIIKCLISVTRIGISCSMENPRERMDIKNVINELYSTRNALLRIKTHSKF